MKGALKMRLGFSLVVTMLAWGGSLSVVAQTRTFENVGRTPSQEEIHAWDTAVGPEGKELPPGRGTAKEGAKIYAQQCASCHGPTGTEAKWMGGALVGGQGPGIPSLKADMSLSGEMGSFYPPAVNRHPYATTIWDYIRRFMPQIQDKQGSLSADEVYALTAFLLYRGGIIEESAVMDRETLPKVRMPNRDGFVPAQPKEGPATDPFGTGRPVR